MISLGHQLVFPDVYERPEEQDHRPPLVVKTAGVRDRDGWLIASDRLDVVEREERGEAA